MLLCTQGDMAQAIDMQNKMDAWKYMQKQRNCIIASHENAQNKVFFKHIVSKRSKPIGVLSICTNVSYAIDMIT